jgi:hypothetical protein
LEGFHPSLEKVEKPEVGIHAIVALAVEGTSRDCTLELPLEDEEAAKMVCW